MQFPMTIGLHRSRFLDAFIVSGALLASAGALAFPVASLIQAGVLSLTCLFAFWAIRQLTPSISAMRLEQNGDVSLRSIVDNEYRVAQIMPGATVHPWLTVVRFKCPEQPVQTLIVTVDSLKAADFRRLRVFLRWRAEISEMSDDA